MHESVLINGKFCIDFQQENDPDKNQLIFNGNICIGFQYKIASSKCTVHRILYRFSVENVTDKNLLIFNRKICIDFQYKMAISKVQQNQQKNVFENPYIKVKGNLI